MYVCVWEFEVREEAVAEFILDYGPRGAWVRLFQQSPGFVTTHLLCDRSRPNRFVTVDQWESRDAHLAFLAAHQAEYDALDRQGARWTRRERLVGEFEEVGPG